MRLFHRGIGVALVAIGLANPLRIFFELGGVEGLREQILEDDGVGNADGLEVLHGAAQVKRAHMGVAGELDGADLYDRAFLDVEVHLHRGRRNGLDIRFDGGELVAVLSHHLLENRFGALDLGLVELALDGQAHMLLLEAVEHIGDGDAVQTLVVDLADVGLLHDEDVEDDALFGVFALDAEIIEVAGVPKGVKVALDGDRIVDVAHVGEEAGQDGLFGNAPIADDTDLVDGLRGGLGLGLACLRAGQFLAARRDGGCGQAEQHHAGGAGTPHRLPETASQSHVRRKSGSQRWKCA